MVPLRQLPDARAGTYMFNCQVDALEQPPLSLVLLFDVSADFLERFFHFHVKVMNVSGFSNPKQDENLSSAEVPKKTYRLLTSVLSPQNGWVLL